MPSVSLKKADMPFLLGGSSEVTVDTADLQLNRPIDQDTTSLLHASFAAGGTDAITLGQSHTVKLSLSTKAGVDIVPVFSTSTGRQAATLRNYGIGDFFKGGANQDKVVLCFDAAASADAAAAGSFPYASLKTSAALAVGADAGYAYLRALDKALPVPQILAAFFETMRLPEQGSRAPEPGEAIFLEYGGYLRLASEVSAGYRLAGTKSIAIGQLALSEKYDLSVIGKIGLSAGVAGRYAILVTGDAVPGWARVQVRRRNAKNLKIAADVNVGFKNELDLPADANDFLGAVLGVNGKNFINVFKKAQELSDFNAFTKSIDGLAKKYVEAVIGKRFDKLATANDFKKFMDVVHDVVASYEQVEDRAVTLFDRYFDKLDQLTSFLDQLQGLSDTGLEHLRKELTAETWAMLSQLTDGDPLGFLLSQVTIKGRRVDSLAELKKRAGAVLALIQDQAHQTIRNAIGIAKAQFGIDKFFRALAKIDTIDELRAVATEEVGLFVTRLVGRQLDSATNVKEAFAEVRAVLLKIDSFADQLFKAFKEASNSSYKMALHGEYSRASEADSLIDVVINMNAARGPALLAAAGTGDFEDVLTITDTDVVRLREGVFTHRVRREHAFKVNIIGWHLNYHYEGFDRVITETEQRLVPSDRGITVLTTATLEVERERKRHDEKVHLNFLLRAIGESARVVKSTADDRAYLIDAVGAMAATYKLAFTDADTSEMELEDYLAFARDVGLAAKGATLADLSPLLPRTPSQTFGDVEASYEVRFDESAIGALKTVKKLTAPMKTLLRNAMGEMVLANFLKSSTMHDAAFAFATPENFEIFDDEGSAKFTGRTQRTLRVRLSNPDIAAPTAVSLDRHELHTLAGLYLHQNAVIKAVEKLFEILAGAAVDPIKFEKALAKFGDALNDFDSIDQTSSDRGIGTNTIFALFDFLVRKVANDATASTAVLRLKSHAAGRTVEKLFLSGA